MLVFPIQLAIVPWPILGSEVLGMIVMVTGLLCRPEGQMILFLVLIFGVTMIGRKSPNVRIALDNFLAIVLHIVIFGLGRISDEVNRMDQRIAVILLPLL